MTSTRLRRPHLLLAAAIGSTVLLSACGSSSSGSAAPAALGSGSPSASALGGAALGSTPSSGAPAAGGGTTKVGGAIIPGSAASTGSGGAGGSATTGGGKSSTGGGTTTSGGQPATAAGAYTYDTSGTVTAGTPRKANGSTTLTVDKPVGDSQHSTLGGGDQGSTDQTVKHTSGGTLLADLKLNNQAFQKEFKPAKPVLLVPRPASPGKSWSWTMTSTDGKTTATFSGKITKTEVIKVGGVATKTSVIESTLKLTGDVTYTAQDTINYDEVHQLQAKDHTRGNGTVGGFAFSTDITSALRSTKPS